MNQLIVLVKVQRYKDEQDWKEKRDILFYKQD